ncbi:hypothetical protein AURDEDRAFT_131290 [Auricularia subglabra TFB-10046 SS5]|uniref:Uncharacterized protein n=1 Tax=Auricularia subglabra (strain TFB-10046 / SS5) TaxID=717982 RepID=J0CUZ2_AURST|nr:hypothetical protein AURDEDRAFT_131290 [Auricularia subglabra TFB-10046 SS5]
MEQGNADGLLVRDRVPRMTGSTVGPSTTDHIVKALCRPAAVRYSPQIHRRERSSPPPGPGIGTGQPVQQESGWKPKTLFSARSASILHEDLFASRNDRDVGCPVGSSGGYKSQSSAGDRQMEGGVKEHSDNLNSGGSAKG